MRNYSHNQVIKKSTNTKKKILFCAALALCLGAGITTAVHVTQAANRASNMMLENVEALAESEIERCPYAAMEYCAGQWTMQIGCRPKVSGEACRESFLNKCPC